MLSKDDVDKMVRDAQEHADEDRQRREQVETRNQADALAFQAERTLRDLGDKVSSEDKADVESKVDGAARGAQGQRHGGDPRHVQRAGRVAPAGRHGRLPGGRSGGRWRRQRSSGESGEDGREPGEGEGEPAADAEAEEAVEGEFKEV